VEYKIIPIPNFEHYAIDTNGAVVNTISGKPICFSVTKGGYVSFRCCKMVGKEKIHTRFLLHRALMMWFVGIDPDPQKCYVDHKDNNPGNNQIDNLRWMTQSENIQRSFDQGRSKSPMAMVGICGKLHSRSKPIIGVNEYGSIVVLFESASLAKKAGYQPHNSMLRNKPSKGLTFSYL
jgi:hypothetical protein